MLLIIGFCVQGYCTGIKSCKTFAVVLVNFGSALGSATDAAALDDLAAYLQPLCGLPACIAADGAHSPISSWFWNGWAPQSAGVLYAKTATVWRCSLIRMTHKQTCG